MASTSSMSPSFQAPDDISVAQSGVTAGPERGRRAVAGRGMGEEVGNIATDSRCAAHGRRPVWDQFAAGMRGLQTL